MSFLNVLFFVLKLITLCEIILVILGTVSKDFNEIIQKNERFSVLNAFIQNKQILEFETHSKSNQKYDDFYG